MMIPGTRLMLYSDGLTECENPAGLQFGSAGLTKTMRDLRRVSGERFFDAMMWDVSAFTGDASFDDDVSALLFDYRGV